jgi:polar amino acid transport system substrate-binding protein
MPGYRFAVFVGGSLAVAGFAAAAELPEAVRRAGALQQAVAGALDALIADGTYHALLAKWHLTDNGIEKATINAGQ